MATIKSKEPVETTVITRELAIAPPDRFISVTDADILSYFTGRLAVHHSMQGYTSQA